MRSWAFPEPTSPTTRFASFKSEGWSSLSGQRSAGMGALGIELAHNVRSPEEVAAVLDEAERAGGPIIRPAGRVLRREWGGTTGAFADPDGYVWEVAHNPGWTLHEDGTIRM